MRLSCQCLLTFFFLSLIPATYAQNFEKVWFDKTDSVFGYYTVIKPTGPRIQGAVVLFDGYGGDASTFFAETKIPNVASANELLTVCIPTGLRMFLDDAHMVMIRKILDEVSKTYGIHKDKFAMGGFSAGGTIALRYVELCYQHPKEFDIHPKALFTADAPVDLLGLYQSSKKLLSRHTQGWWLGEAKMIIDSLDAQIGPPTPDLAKYRQVSPFLASDTTPGNEQALVHVAYRTYHDVDVEWALKYRQQSIYDRNMLNASELVNRLLLLGNTQAEFVSSPIHGRRSNGQMHPHSWNIIDEIDLISWIREKLDFYPGDAAKRYTYNVEGWPREVIVFPMDFAPALPYKGYEDLRFAPGFSDAASEEKWAYTFVWWLDGVYSFDEKILQQNLEAYYSGLTRSRAVADKDDLKAYFPARVAVRKTATVSGDLSTYGATLHIFDALVTKKSGDLYMKIHVKACSDSHRTILVFEASAFPTTQPLWNKLDKINADFGCAK
ncbi:MAG TPA: hypothetical protein VL832_03145 [Puia sp.]|nr:hypothetical protein [Puia sp.]